MSSASSTPSTSGALMRCALNRLRVWQFVFVVLPLIASILTTLAVITFVHVVVPFSREIGLSLSACTMLFGPDLLLARVSTITRNAFVSGRAMSQPFLRAISDVYVMLTVDLDSPLARWRYLLSLLSLKLGQLS